MEYVVLYSVWKGQGSSLEKENIWLIVVNSWDLITSYETPLSLIPIRFAHFFRQKKCTYLVDKFQSPMKLAYDQYFQPKQAN